jgi:hypothetical protein
VRGEREKWCDDGHCKRRGGDVVGELGAWGRMVSGSGSEVDIIRRASVGLDGAQPALWDRERHRDIATPLARTCEV